MSLINFTKKNFNFLNKVSDLQNDVVIKIIKTKDNKRLAQVVAVNDSISFIIKAIQFNTIFEIENDSNVSKFGLKNVKSFLNLINFFNYFQDTETKLIFRKDETEEIIFQKINPSLIRNVKPPEIDLNNAIHFVLENNNIKKIIEGLKNYSNFSEIINISFLDDIFIFQIGQENYENFYSLKIKLNEVNNLKENNFIMKFNLKLFYKLFKTFDEDIDKVDFYIFVNKMLLAIEKTDVNYVEYYLASIIENEF